MKALGIILIILGFPLFLAGGIPGIISIGLGAFIYTINK